MGGSRVFLFCFVLEQQTEKLMGKKAGNMVYFVISLSFGLEKIQYTFAVILEL